MQIKKNLRIIIIASLSFLLLYTFVAVRPLSKELQLTPQWTISILQSPAERVESAESVLPFRLGQTMGYFTQDGQIALLESFPFHSTISSTYRTAYAPDSSRIPVHSFDSQKDEPDFYLEGAGFPYFSEDRMYILSPGGYGLSQHSREAGQLWQFEHSAPITTVSSSPAGTAVGYADGTVFIFSDTGELLQTFEPGGSGRSIILGAALSDSGSLLACVSGIDQQRFVLTQQRNGVNKVVFHTYLEGNLHEPVLVQFSDDEGKVFYACKNGVGIVDCRSFASTTIPLDGRLLAIQECPANKVVCILTKDGGRYNIYLIEGQGTLIGSFGFEASSAFIAIKDGGLYIGRDTTISKIDLNRK